MNPRRKAARPQTGRPPRKQPPTIGCAFLAASPSRSRGTANFGTERACFTSNKTTLGFFSAILSALRLEMLHLVRRGAIHPGELDVVQSQVDAELPSMVDEVADDHASHHCCARHRKNLLPFVGQ